MSTADRSKNMKTLNTYQYFVTKSDTCTTIVSPATGQVYSYKKS